MSSPRVMKSKIIKTQPLMKDPFVSSYIPETCEYSMKNLEYMVNKYPSVYIKPDYGSLGVGIIRLKLLEDGKHELSYEKVRRVLPANEAKRALHHKLEKEKSYVIQQGIDLATLNNRPFDLRAVLQKVMDRWQLSLLYAKVAIEKNAVVTNISRGNRRVPLETVLMNNDQDWDGLITLRHLIDVSHQIAHILGQEFPVEILGLDMAIDKGGNIWFIEANTKPQVKGLRAVNDALSYRKFIEAKRQTS